jgi:hypothetical protein
VQPDGVHLEQHYYHFVLQHVAHYIPLARAGRRAR